MTADGGQAIAIAGGDAAPLSPAAPVKVDVGPCRCPGQPHAVDSVWLAPRVPISLGVAAMAALNGIASTNEYIGILGGLYLRFGIVRWTFVDAKGEPEQITPEALERLLPWGDGGYEVAEAADTIYGAEVLRPLQRRSLMRSVPGLMEPSTSPPPEPSPPTPTLPSPSSPPVTDGTPSGVPV